MTRTGEVRFERRSAAAGVGARRGLAIAVAAGGLAACEVVPPPAACPAKLIEVEIVQTYRGLSFPCTFPKALYYPVTRSLTAAVGDSEATPVTNPYGGVLVGVSSQNEAIALCPGLGCEPNARDVAVRADRRGLAQYTARLDPSVLGLPGPGGETSVAGDAILETYGPGNACLTLMDVRLACELPAADGG